MNDEFTAWCNDYYQLTKRLTKQDERFKHLLDNALPYSGQRNLSDLDAILSCNRKVQAAKAKVDKTFKELTEARDAILQIMEYFEIQPYTVLIGQIPGELEYEVWANGKGNVFIGKIRDLPREPDNRHIIYIKCSGWDKEDDED